MPSLLQLTSFLLFALITFSLAAPSTPAKHVEKRSFKVERIPNPKYKGRTVGAGTRALIKAHRKYKVALPPGLLDAMNAANAGGGGGAGGGAVGDVVSSLEAALADAGIEGATPAK